MPETKDKVVIIGAGLTGLTTAFYLKEYGIEVSIIEKATRTGGVIQSVKENGFTYECGPNTGTLGTAEAAELFEDLANSCTLETANPDAKRRLIWKKGKWHALPSGPISAIKTPLFRLKDKINVLFEPFRSKGKDEMESVSSMVNRRLGKSFLDYAINPFISGVYAGDPDKLVLKYALPKLYTMEQEYGSLVLGGMKRSKKIKQDPFLRKATREVFSVTNGLSGLTQALTNKIGADNILLECDIQEVTQEDAAFKVSYYQKGKKQMIKASRVISTIGAYALPDLFPFLDKQKLIQITNLKYVKVAQVILGFKEWLGMPLNAFGGLVPTREKKNLLGVLFTSSFFKNRAPEKGCLLSVFLGGSRLPTILELSDEEIKELVLANMKDMMECNLEPDLFKIYKYEHAIPQYEASSKERLEAISAIEDTYKGLHLAGNIRDGIGMADRIKQGRILADTIAGK